MKCVLPCALLMAASLAVHESAAAPPAAQTGQLQDGGLVVQWSYQPTLESSGEEVGTLDVVVHDQLTSTPIDYGRGALLGWLQLDRHALSDREITCAQRVTSFISQGVGRRADFDLNTYRIVTLNADGSVAFINPFVGFNNAKLEAIIDLMEEPSDWVIDPKRMEAWVLLGQSGRLAGIDLQSHKLINVVDLPRNASAQHLFQDVNGNIVVPMPTVASIGIVDPQRPSLS